ncbi:CinA family protein [Marmoricola sp. URHB0036]|uniref:CinA family protein n=1 Tax=Marmoricola sp. URHB0036 TaxID=1298863 RepID=UPI00040EA2B4|nr:nicotinamide-nucleotide amidohydrolase family protein [Marmoricola sp. URHB0036]
MTDPALVHAALLERGLTVGCAESLTGGELAAMLSATPGASGTFVGGVVSYSTEVKRRLLSVTAAEVVSGECAVQMAAGARDLLEVDWAVSTTGVAGPDLQEGRPVGTVFVGLASSDTARFVRLDLDGDRDAIRSGACAGALDLLLAEVTRG